MRRVIVSGDRYFAKDDKQPGDSFNYISTALSTLVGTDAVVIHGSCSREYNNMEVSTDMLAHYACKILGIRVVPVEAEWERYGKGAGPKRNKEMITLHGGNELWAFHRNLSQSKGTNSMISQAIKYGLVVKIFNE